MEERTQAVSEAMVGRGEGSSTSGSTSTEMAIASSSRPQAEPLPSKLGEIGYQVPEEADIAESAGIGIPQVDSSAVLHVGHPTDRDSPVPTPTSSTSQPMTRDVEASISTATTAQSPSNKTILSRLKSKSESIIIFSGIRLVTFLLFFLQVALLLGSVIGWIALTTHIHHSKSNEENGVGVGAPGSTQIFVHVAFGIGILVQVVLLERRVFRMRAEMYYHAHPGLPTHATAAHGDGTIFGLAPWNRPSLPTYAAALAQSGVGTGDVEDNMIAVQPPPAYGYTRGSTLVLAGFMSDTLRAQRTEEEEARRRRGNRDSSASSSSGTWERPVSYRSHDEEWEQRRDGMRAARLEETLARLEEGAGAGSRTREDTPDSRPT